MIITTPKELEVGKICTEDDFGVPLQIFHEFHFKYRFMVMRESTLEEYRAYVASIYENPDEIANLYFYYEISMD